MDLWICNQLDRWNDHGDDGDAATHSRVDHNRDGRLTIVDRTSRC